MNHFFPMKPKTYNFVASLQCVLVVVLLFLLFNAFFAISIVPSESMYPTLQVREFLFCHNDRDYDYDDIAVFYPTPQRDVQFVKRVIGKGGDTIQVANGHLYRNGEIVTASYTAEAQIDYEMPEVTVPEGSYFMMGDNRNHSGDSHIIGCIDESQCKAQVLFHFIPFWWDAT